MKFVFRKKGIPMRLMRIPGGVPGLVSACNVHMIGREWPAAKVAFFKDRKSMRHFDEKILPRYRSGDSVGYDSLTRRCAGFVRKLAIENVNLKTTEIDSIEVDRRFFCFVGLVEGYLTAEILAHEGTHVGFAWDYRTRQTGPYAHKHNAEENICYPAGIFVDQVITHIKREGLREI